MTLAFLFSVYSCFYQRDGNKGRREGTNKVRSPPHEGGGPRVDEDLETHR